MSLADTAIWTFVLGRRADRYLWQLRLWVDSLRRLGRYSGHIVVFRAAGADRLLSPAYDVEEVEVAVARGGRRDAQMFKLEVWRHYDFSQFDRVLGADCDGLALGYLTPLFTAGGEINATLANSPMRAAKFSRLLRPEEMEMAAGRRGINSGFYACPGGMVREICERWTARHFEGEPGARLGPAVPDQHSFNRMLLLGDYDFLPWAPGLAIVPNCLRGTGHSLDDLPPETRLLHYCGAKRDRQRLYNAYLTRLGAMG